MPTDQQPTISLCAYASSAGGPLGEGQGSGRSALYTAKSIAALQEVGEVDLSVDTNVKTTSPNTRDGKITDGLRNLEQVKHACEEHSQNVAVGILTNGKVLSMAGDHSSGLATIKGALFGELINEVIKEDSKIKISDNTRKVLWNTVAKIKEGERTDELFLELGVLFAAHYESGEIEHKEVREFLDTIPVVWLDAHGDYNNRENSPSGNIHGMPLEAVTDHGRNWENPLIEIIHPIITANPNMVYHLCGRDLDPATEELPSELDRMQADGINMYTQDYIDANGGLLAVIEEITEEIKEKTNGATSTTIITADGDFLDAQDFQYTGTPVGTGSKRNPNVGPGIEEGAKALELLATELQPNTVEVAETMLDDSKDWEANILGERDTFINGMALALTLLGQPAKEGIRLAREFNEEISNRKYAGRIDLPHEVAGRIQQKKMLDNVRANWNKVAAVFNGERC